MQMRQTFQMGNGGWSNGGIQEPALLAAAKFIETRISEKSLDQRAVINISWGKSDHPLMFDRLK